MRPQVLVGTLMSFFIGTSVQAAECTADLRERWTVAQSEMIAINLKAREEQDMKRKHDVANLCQGAQKMRAYDKLAQDYFYACEPLSASINLQYIGQLMILTDKFLHKFDCQKLIAEAKGIHR